MNKKSIFLYVNLLFVNIFIDYMCEMYVIILKKYILEKHTNFNMENKMYKIFFISRFVCR